MKFKYYFPILLMFNFMNMSCQDRKIELGKEISIFSKSSNKEQILNPKNKLVDYYSILSNNIQYNITVNSEQQINFITTKDPNFIIDHDIKVGTKLIDIKEPIVEHIPGWGYYTQINTTWYAGFNYKEKPNSNSKIESSKESFFL